MMHLRPTGMRTPASPGYSMVERHARSIGTWLSPGDLHICHAHDLENDRDRPADQEQAVERGDRADQPVVHRAAPRRRSPAPCSSRTRIRTHSPSRSGCRPIRSRRPTPRSRPGVRTSATTMVTINSAVHARMNIVHCVGRRLQDRSCPTRKRWRTRIHRQAQRHGASPSKTKSNRASVDAAVATGQVAQNLGADVRIGIVAEVIRPVVERRQP